MLDMGLFCHFSPKRRKGRKAKRNADMYVGSFSDLGNRACSLLNLGWQASRLGKLPYLGSGS